MKIIAITIIATTALAAFSWALLTGIERSEMEECLQWQQEAKQFAGYYLTKWQYQQCLVHGILIDNVPVMK